MISSLHTLKIWNHSRFGKERIFHKGLRFCPQENFLSRKIISLQYFLLRSVIKCWPGRGSALVLSYASSCYSKLTPFFWWIYGFPAQFSLDFFILFLSVFSYQCILLAKFKNLHSQTLYCSFSEGLICFTGRTLETFPLYYGKHSCVLVCSLD